VFDQALFVEGAYLIEQNYRVFVWEKRDEITENA